MTQLLIRLFIRNHRDTDDPAVRAAYGRLAGLTGIVTNLMLTAAKLTVGILFHSVAIIADAVNNLTDSASSIVTLIGFRLAAKPADREHPYGHARLEYVAGLIVSIIIFIVGFELGRTSLDKAIHPGGSEFHWVTVVVLGISILGKLWQSLFYRKMGRTIRSGTLKANAVDSLNDVLATSVVLGGSILTYFIGFDLDGYLGMAVALFIMISGVRLIQETVSPLLGQAPSASMVRQLREIFDHSDGILGYHDLQIHDYGEQHYHATVHFEIDSGRTLEEAHAMIDALERQVRERTGVELVAHLDPIAVGDPRTDQLREEVLTMLHGISKDIHIHDFQVLWEEDPVRITYDLAVPYRFHISDSALLQMATRRTEALGEHFSAQILIDHEGPADDTDEPEDTTS